MLSLADHDFAACSPLNLHGLLAGNQEFVAQSPFQFCCVWSSSCNYRKDYTQQKIDLAAFRNLQIDTLDRHFVKTTITHNKYIYISLLLTIKALKNMVKVNDVQIGCFVIFSIAFWFLGPKYLNALTLFILISSSSAELHKEHICVGAS